MSFSLHEHSWVHDRVATGSWVLSPLDIEALRRDGITHVVCCAEIDVYAYARLYEGSAISYVLTPMADDGCAKRSELFLRGTRYAIRALRASPDHKVLTHCASGVNRGPSMAYSILRALNLSPADAESAIRKARPRATIAYLDDAERAVGLWTDGVVER